VADGVWLLLTELVRGLRAFDEALLLRLSHRPFWVTSQSVRRLRWCRWLILDVRTPGSTFASAQWGARGAPRLLRALLPPWHWSLGQRGSVLPHVLI